MFTKFRIQNFRTHIDTEVSLKDLTLIIGANNSGKTNLLEALSFFSGIVRRGAPDSENKKVYAADYAENKHSLSTYEPIVFTCESIYTLPLRKVNYKMAITYHNYIEETLEIDIKGKKEKFEHGHEDLSNELLLWKITSKLSINDDRTDLINIFFTDLSTVLYFNLQPSILKGRKSKKETENNDYDIESEKSELECEGGNLELLIGHLIEGNNEIYDKNKFLGFLRRFESSFININVEKKGLKWVFDMGNSNFPSFSATKISDGLIKAAAVALLCSMENPPSVIMLEEIENGINQKNLAEFLQWLVNASDNGKKTQFIVTSHSPSVIREFADKIDSVYNVHLKKKKGYVSEVTNLNDALKPLVRFGAIKEEFVQEIDGVIHLKPYALTELFYNGILGEL